MTLLGLFGGYLSMLMGGAGIALLLMNRLARVNVIEFLCLAWLFGVGVVSLSLWLAGNLVSGPALQGFVTALCLLLAIVGWRAKRKGALRLFVPLPRNLLEWLLAVALLLELAAIFVLSLQHTLGWDGLLNWEIKARYASLNAGKLPVSYFSAQGRAFSHPEYPLAIPFTELWLYLWMGVAHQFWVKTIFPLFYIAGALFVCLFVSRLTGKRWLGLLIALLMPLVPFVTTSPGGVSVGYADIPLAVFYVVAVGYLLWSVESNTTASFAIYAGLLTVIPWIKSEGTILWAILAVIVVFLAWRKGKTGLGFLSILPGLFVILGWRCYLYLVHAVKPADFAEPTPQLLIHNFKRIGQILSIVSKEVTEVTNWSLFWLLVLVAAIYLLAWRRLLGLMTVIAVVAPIALYLLTYVFSAWPDFTLHVASSVPRLLLQVMPVGWLAIGLAIGCRGLKHGVSVE